jgi:hypothetical protein
MSLPALPKSTLIVQRHSWFLIGERRHGMKSNLIVQLIGMCMFFTLFACSNAMQLAYTKPPAADFHKGEIAVVLDDRRVPERGGNDPLLVGIARNAFGMPFDIKASPKREPSKVTRELITECLTASGYKVVDAGSNAPQLHAELRVFWSDGYQHSRMGLQLPMELKKSLSSSPVWEHDLNINSGFTWKSAGFSQFNAGFNKMLEEAKIELLQQFQNSQFEKSYKNMN